jgi:hypothetical protein
VLGILFIVATPRLALVLPLVTLAYFAVILKPIWYGSHGFKQASAGALFQGIRTGDRDWLDAAVSPGTTIGVLWTGRTDRFTVNENEFFNRSVGPVYYVGGPTPGGLPETEARFDRRGIVRLADGSELTSRYMLLEPDIDPDGRIVATDAGTGMTLWRLFGPLRTTVGVTGIYPGDTWSGRRVVYRKEPCRPGTLAVAVGSDPSLFHKPSTIVVRENGSVVTRFNLEPVSARVVFRVPLRPAGGVCRVVFDVSRTAVPSRVQPGNADTRRLGAHFYGFVRER